MSGATEVFRDVKKICNSGKQKTVIVARVVGTTPELTIYTYTRTLSNPDTGVSQSSKSYTVIGPTGLTTATELLDLFLRSEDIARERLLSL